MNYRYFFSGKLFFLLSVFFFIFVAIFSTKVSNAASPVITYSKTTVNSGETFQIEVTGGDPNATFCLYLGGEAPKDVCIKEGSQIKLDASGNGKFVGLTFSSDDDMDVVIKIAQLRSDGTYGVYNTTTVKVKGSNTSATPDPGKTPPTQTTGIPECDALPKVPRQIQRGSRGDDVVCAQKLLTQQGYATESDGQFGPKTEAAVLLFQQNNTKCKDGIIGPETWGALLGIVIDQNSGCNPVGTTDPNKTPGTGQTPGGSGSSGLNCGIAGLNEENGLCFPENPLKGKKGIVSCDSIGNCLNSIIRFLLTIVAIIAVLFIIIGGFQYVTSAGNESRAESGKRTLQYAIMGLGAVILAYTIVAIVYSALTSNSIL